MADPAVVSEVLAERWWRHRCGSPNLNAWPVRCRRDVDHPSPHVGFRDPAELIAWPGAGAGLPLNHISGMNLCWCPGNRPGEREVPRAR